MCRSFGVRFFVGNRQFCMDGVAYKYGFYESKFVVAIAESHWIDGGRRQPNANGKNHGAVRNALPKGLRLHELRVHVMREKVPRVTGMHHEVGFCQGAA